MSYHEAKRAKMEEGNANEIQRQSTSKKMCDLGTHKFSEVVEFDTFVDKSLFIKSFFDESVKAMALLAPRGFGKSTNMNMLQEFLTGNRKLFEDHQLKIWKEERNFFDEYCRKYPVIYLDFKTVGGKTKYEFFESLNKVIGKAFNEHRYLVKEVNRQYSWSDSKLKHMGKIANYEMYWKNPENLNDIEMALALMILSKCLHLYHGERVYVLLDNYDHPMLQTIQHKVWGDRLLYHIIDIVSRLICNLFVNNEHLERGLLYGCIQISNIDEYDRNIKWYEFLNHPLFSPHFGFTDNEVKSLFEKKEFAPFKHDDIEKWYNGYKSTYTKNYTIYNCYSILKYLKNSIEMNKPHFGNYWVDSANISYPDQLFGEDSIRQHVKELLNGKNYRFTIRTLSFSGLSILHIKHMVHQENDSNTHNGLSDFFYFLIANGYLNAEYIDRATCSVRIPNEEIKEFFQRKYDNGRLYEC